MDYHAHGFSFLRFFTTFYSLPIASKIKQNNASEKVRDSERRRQQMPVLRPLLSKSTVYLIGVKPV
jgi:hypothetical protein